MSKGKKKRKGATSAGGAAKPAKATGKGPEFGTLASRLGDAARKLAEQRKEEERAAREAERARRNAPPPARKVTEDELMAEAFRAAGETSAAAAKFLGEGYDAGNVEVVRAAAAEGGGAEEQGEGATAPELTHDDLVFLEAMSAQVERLDTGREALRTREWTGLAWRTDVELASLTPEQLVHLELTPTHRDLLRRARKSETEALNVRHYSREDALRQVEAFVIGCAARQLRYVRVIHGKGRQSAEGPVLKPAVIAWCEGPGARWVRAWAPEVDRTGQYGSLVLELYRPRG